MTQLITVAIAAITLAGFSPLALADDMGKMKGAVEAAKDKKDDMKTDMKGKVDEMKGKPEAAMGEGKSKLENMKGAVAK